MQCEDIVWMFKWGREMPVVYIQILGSGWNTLLHAVNTIEPCSLTHLGILGAELLGLDGAVGAWDDSVVELVGRLGREGRDGAGGPPAEDEETDGLRGGYDEEE